MSEIVGLLLDDAMPSERLGALLRDARKRRGLKRKEAAAAAGTTAARLRAYERGDEPVPAGVCALLADRYGDDLTAHFPRRVPPAVRAGSVAVGGELRAVGWTPADVVAGYVEIVRRLRGTRPGEPLPLRSTDITALAGALGHDRELIEQRIAEVLECTPAEARRLHGELLRRKVILPVAGLAAGVAAFAGTAHAAASPSTTRHAPSSEHAPQPTTTTTTTTTPAPMPTAAPEAAREPAPVAEAAAPGATGATGTTTTTAPAPATPPVRDTARTDATVPPADRAADVPVRVEPRPDPGDPPVSVLPGETPITIIGAPDSAATPIPKP